MDALLAVDDSVKRKLVERWSDMSESDKTHFINQLSLALSIWGSDDRGKDIAVQVFRLMVGNGSSTLADFGLYVDALLRKGVPEDRKKKVERVALILDGYRLKNGLPSEPHREIT